MSGPSPQPLSGGGERGCFGEAAARLCGAASMALGWRPEEFWNATPAELLLAMSLPLADPPDAATIEMLRRRFPDEPPQARPTNMKAAAPTMQTNAPR
jgi:hypothetical protein